MRSTTAAVVASAGVRPVLEQVWLEPPAHGEALVRIAAVGVCHTDIAWAAGEYGATADEFPIVLGHEASGVVESTGRPDSAFAPGDRVVIALTNHCGVCRDCESGFPILCANREKAPPRLRRPDGSVIRQGFGVGGFGEATVVREANLVRVPDAVPLDVAAVVGCAVACGTGAVWNLAQVRPGSTVAVFGAGAVGVSVVMGCQLAGAHHIVVVDPNPERRALALQCGATHAVDFGQALDSVVDGGLVDYAFESVGKPAAMEAAVRCTRRGGTVTLMGAAQRDAVFSLNALEFVSSQRRLLGCLGGNVRPHYDFDQYFRLYLAGKFDLESLITRRLPLERIAEAFDPDRAAAGLRTVLLNPDERLR